MAAMKTVVTVAGMELDRLVMSSGLLVALLVVVAIYI